jgi:FkbM family methyltransferase
MGEGTVVAEGFDRGLIYDLGMHRGLDTRFYLDKGFRVVALEANPAMISKARDEFVNEISENRLHLVESALWSEGGQNIPFFVNENKDDWSSVYQEMAEKGGNSARQVTVGTTTLGEMFDRYGIPYYIKCDIEGADRIFIKQLLADPRRSAFVSVEASSGAVEDIALLFAAGYDRVQIINQALLGTVVPPNPPREGNYTDRKFNGHMSGLFGRELNPKSWMKIEIAIKTYIDFHEIRKRNAELAYGWLDFHFSSTEILDDACNW